jgi:A/G-specific adenine glycosylase
MRRPNNAEVATFRESLLRWFACHGRRFPWRRRRATLYQLILPEILLQRMQAEVVAAFLPQFLERFPSWDALAPNAL